MKKFTKITISILLLIVFFLIGGMIIINKLSESATQVPDLDVDIRAIADGVYYGEYSISPVHVKTKLQLQNGEIQKIELLEHTNGFGKSAEAIIDKIIKQQSLAVDTISGATVSSKCILKAVENALLHREERN